jgi:hypothetical protein
MATATPPTNTEAAILSRVIRPKDSTLSQAAARALLRLDFDRQDRDRMHVLAVRNQQGKLTEPEQAELQSYVHVGLILDLLRSKARRSLKRATPRR